MHNAGSGLALALLGLKKGRYRTDVQESTSHEVYGTEYNVHKIIQGFPIFSIALLVSFTAMANALYWRFISVDAVLNGN